MVNAYLNDDTGYAVDSRWMPRRRSVPAVTGHMGAHLQEILRPLKQKKERISDR
jgi:hypothetical protein